MDPNDNKGSDDALSEANETLLDEAEALIWALLDDEIETADLKRLENLLAKNASVREHYIQCVQMHTDLFVHFNPAEQSAGSNERPKSPVLGMLGDLRPGTDTLPPVPPAGN